MTFALLAFCPALDVPLDAPLVVDVDGRRLVGTAAEVVAEMHLRSWFDQDVDLGGYIDRVAGRFLDRTGAVVETAGATLAGRAARLLRALAAHGLARVQRAIARPPAAPAYVGTALN